MVMGEKNRTEVICFRVTKNELEKVKSMADLSEKTISEWCKQIIVKIVNRDSSTGLGLVNLGEKIILEQLILLRILLSNGLADRELTEDKLKRLIKKADEIKGEKVEQLIKEFITEGL